MRRKTLFTALTATAISLQSLYAAPRHPDLPKPKPQAEVVAENNNSFAISLYQELQKKPGNVFFSPFSISSALAMTIGGANKDTATEMAATLQFTSTSEKLHAGWLALQTQLTKDAKDNYQLSIANKIWAEELYKEAFHQSFFTLTKTFYGAALEMMNFKDADGSASAINKWASDNTNKKIEAIVTADIFKAPDPVSMVLTNAIYFKGDWASQFKKETTKSETFFMGEKATTKVDLMYQQSQFRYTEDANVQVLAMPYKGDSLEMVVILPKKKEGLAAAEKALTAKQLQTWLAQMSAEDVKVKLPKFKMESDYSLVKPLKELGMKKAFDPIAADFSNLADLKKLSQLMKGPSNLYIWDVLHKGFVEVNEEGSEAAAVTAVVISVTTTSVHFVPPPKIFTADHPFLFMIRDTKSSAILFMGRLSEPTPTK